MTSPFLLLNPADNVLVARTNVAAGSQIRLEARVLIVEQAIPLAHKIARFSIKKGEKILKYGMPIGTATSDIRAGAHVHIHNIQSNYTPTHSLQDADGQSGMTDHD